VARDELGREPWNRRKDVMTFSIEIVKEGFMSKKYAFPGRTSFYDLKLVKFIHL
jgi:hypothetical protein